MALTPTLLADYASVLSEKGLDFHEQRIGQYGGYQFAKKDADNIVNVNDINSGRTAPSRVVKVPVLNKETVTINGARSLTITGNDSTSAFQTVTYVTLASDITMRPIENDGNYISYLRQFEQKMEALEFAWLKQLDQLVINGLILGRTQFDASAGVPYALTGNILQVPNANKLDFFNEIDAIYDVNEFNSDMLTILGSSRVKSLVHELDENALYNAENKLIRLDNKEVAYSTRVPFAGSYGAFVLLKNSCGILNWNSPEAVRGYKESESKFKTIEYLPRVGMDVEVLWDNSFTDLSATLGAGTETAMVHRMQFSTDVAIVTAYNSAPLTQASPIFQVNIV